MILISTYLDTVLIMLNPPMKAQTNDIGFIFSEVIMGIILKSQLTTCLTSIYNEDYDTSLIIFY